MLDDALVEELRAAAGGEQQVATTLAVDFLFSHGLVLDGAEAEVVCDRWAARGLVITNEADQTRRERSSSGDSTGTMVDLSASGAFEPAGLFAGTGDAQLPQEEAAQPPDNARSDAGLETHLESETLRRALQVRHPGLHEVAGGGMGGRRRSTSQHKALRQGDSLSLSASGLWVSTLRGPRGALQRAGSATKGLFLQPDSAKSECFHVATSERSGRAPSASAVNPTGVVHFGDYVWLQNDRGDTWQVQFVCPGQVGPVRMGCHVVIIDVHEDARTDSTRAKPSWGMAAAQSALCAGTPIVLNKVCNGRTRAPVVFTIHPDDFTGGARRLSDMHRPSLEPLGQSRRSPTSSARPEPTSTLSVLVYNVWMLPGPVTCWATPMFGSSPKKMTRARLIPLTLRAAVESVCSTTALPDIAVLCGAQCEEATPVLKAGLKRELGLHFETVVLGAGLLFSKAAKPASGGVAVLSKYPILRTAHHVFRNSTAEDRFVAKGVTYACVHKSGRNIHVLAMHLQTGPGEAAVRVRELQLQEARRFSQELALPTNELVLFVGDLNVCKFKDMLEHERLLDSLGAVDTTDPVPPELLAEARERLSTSEQGAPQSRELVSVTGDNLLARRGSGRKVANSPPLRHSSGDSKLMHSVKRQPGFVQLNADKLFSFNPNHNTLAGLGLRGRRVPGLLDYVLYSRHHLQPVSAQTRVLHRVKAQSDIVVRGQPVRDLSSHFPVLCTIEF